ncbi:MAG TPA: NAD(P)H-binding protein [Ramlibacter sp.]|nr:NAD(P)H-binding protein [Ramlibacter sp.]
MKIVVLGANGLVGCAVANEFESRGHEVKRAARHGADIAIDFRFDLDADTLRAVVRGADVVVNAIGILIERDGNTFDGVHRAAAQALAAACEAERVARVIQVSALGAGTGIPGAFMASKLAAEQAFERHSVDFALVRAGLLVDAECPSTRLFQFLARLPVIALPGLLHPGASRVAPIQVNDVARSVARIAEHPKALRRVIEIAGTDVMSYRTMLDRYRKAQGKGNAFWLPVPWWLMKLGARLASVLPQKVFSIDTLRMLQAGSIAHRNEAPRWLAREPMPMTGAGQPTGAAAVVSIG